MANRRMFSRDIVCSDRFLDMPRSGKDRVDKERVSINGGKSSRFVPPTVKEVREYCLERGNNVDAQCFVDFYSSKGWYIGKSKMRDWKASVRTWERKERSNSQGRTTEDGLEGWLHA